jgi:hypothetical protein
VVWFWQPAGVGVVKPPPVDPVGAGGATSAGFDHMVAAAVMLRRRDA